MRLMLSLLGCLLLAGGALAQPSIDAGGVVNAASYAPPGLPNSAIAQGSIFIIFGKNMGPATLAQAPFPLPTVLAGTSVRVTVGGQTVDAFIIYTSAGQLAALLPSRTPAGTGTVTVTYNSQTSATAPITVVASSFGIFTINQGGSGPGVITFPDYSVNLLTAAANAENALVLWGTGLGPVEFDETRGAPVRDLRHAGLEVLVGGRRAVLDFAGRAPGFAGLDQINFRVPGGVEGCYVPVVVRIGGVVSNFSTMSVAGRGRVCSDPVSFSEEDMGKVAADKDFSMGLVLLSRMDIALPSGLPISGSITTDSGSGSFTRYNFRKLIGSRGVSGLAPFGHCIVYTYKGEQFSTTDPVLPDGLDAGASLSLSGPGGAKTLARKAKGQYSADLGGGGIPGFGGGQPLYLTPGRYTVTGPGGDDVGPFTATLEIVSPVNWNRTTVPDTIPRSQDLPLTWTGGTATDYVQIIGTSGRTNPAVGAIFMCTERADRGNFTVPSWVLSALPPSEQSGSGMSATPGGMLMLGSSPLLERNKFNARGLDLGYFSYSNLAVKTVGYR